MGDNMGTKKLLFLFIVLVVIYFSVQISINFLRHGHHVTYNLKDDDKKVIVDEIYTKNVKNERDNYLLNIKVNNIEFSIQLFDDFKGHNYILKDIEYVEKDKYKCIYPIFKNKKQYTDFVCYDGSEYINYSIIKGENKDLDSYIKDVKIYSEIKDDSSIEPLDNINVFKDNIVYKHYLSLEYYKGIYLINKKNSKEISLFKKDIYTKNIHYYIDNYYLVADYDSDYTFNNIYLINIKDGRKTTVKNNKDISFDSYIMGDIDQEVYFLDKSNKKQYKISYKNKDIFLTSNNDEVIIYKDNKEEKENIYNALEKKITFNKYSYESTSKNYARIDKVGNKLSGYYYLYQKDKDTYKIYRSNIQDDSKLIYIADTSDIDNIVYIDDYIYFKYDDAIKYYNDKTGIKTVVKNSEFKYNKSLLFGVS